jgi:hypothetical protein
VAGLRKVQIHRHARRKAPSQTCANPRLGIDSADLFEDGEQLLGIGVAHAEQIDIARRPELIVDPGSEQHRAFEDKALAVSDGHPQRQRSALRRPRRPLQLVEAVGLLAQARHCHRAIKPSHPQENGRHERMHPTLKKETTRPPGMNSLQEQEPLQSIPQRVQ